MTKPHGMTSQRGLDNGASTFHEEGRFGRLFRTAKAFSPPDQYLIDLGLSMELEVPGDESGDSKEMPAGFTFLGQFVAHDITFDTTSALDRKNDPAAIKDFRTPGLDLDCVYGLGPEANPFLYDQNDKAKLLTGTEKNPEDLQRNRQHVALIGDPRNDVSLITSQLHLLFLKFHNRIVDHLREEGVPEAEVFEEAERLTRWHYQWILIWEYIPKLTGPDIIADIRANGRKFYHFKHHPFIPVEFTVAAYRFGHSQLRSVYKLNEGCPAAKLFSELGAFNEVPPEHVVDWRNFFDLDPACPPQPGRKIDTKIALETHDLPFVPDKKPELRSLSVRNLLRGKALGLPSGQTVARRMGIEPLTSEEMGIKDEAPLWYYILKEAELLHDGERLGEVGGRIVAEIFHGFLKSDEESYVCAEPLWKPTLPSATPEHFTMADMVRFIES
ncbi:MAG: heme peroxidase family protein [Acidobacteriota bacterium]